MNQKLFFALSVAAISAGTATADTLQVPADHPTIQSAIDAATDRDTILVSPGTWAEHLDLLGKAITIQGDGAASDVILASPDGGTMIFIDGEVPPIPMFADLTFTGGIEATLVQINRGSPTFQRCIFRDNLARAITEGGICTDSDGGTYIDCLFIDNQEPNGGAVRINQSNSLFVGCAFVNNIATGPTSGVNAGGALYIDDWGCGTHVVSMQECFFSQNDADWGGVIYVQGFYPSATFRLDIEHCRFVSNTATQGRSLWAWYTDLRILGTNFCGGGDQIRNSWTDLGENIFNDTCGEADFDDCDDDRIPDALAITLGIATDCNADGLPDGCTVGDPKIDADGNGIPDSCEDAPCPGDVTGNGIVDAADLGILLAVWGTAGKNNPLADVNGDGTVDASDLGLLLGAWGLCP